MNGWLVKGTYRPSILIRKKQIFDLLKSHIGIVENGAKTKWLSRANSFVFRLKTLDSHFVRRLIITMFIWRGGLSYDARFKGA